MRRASYLVVGVATGAYAGWRASRSGVGRLVAPSRSQASGPAVSAEKVKALVVLGRERARVAIDQVLGGRAA